MDLGVASTSRARRKTRSSRTADRTRNHLQSDATASPEIITSLITSLSEPSPEYVSKSRQPLPDSLPTPDRTGSFGVDYGAYSTTTASGNEFSEDNLDELAASPPVIKTSKQPSGFSTLTATKAPPRRDSSSGLKSLLSQRSSLSLTSRPSRPSLEAEARSAGSFSTAPGSPPPTDLRRQGSQDSWGKKTGRTQLNLLYLPSKERLRDNEERKRISVGGSGSNTKRGSSLGRTTSPGPEPILAETTIVEEPSSSTKTSTNRPNPGMSSEEYPNSPRRPIPERDSSLYRTGASARRLSARASQSSKRNSRVDPDMAISSIERRNSDSPLKNGENMRRPQNAAGQSPQKGKHIPVVDDDLHRNSFRNSTISYSRLERYLTDTDYDPEEGAPSPSIAQSRRRDRDLGEDRSSWRRSSYAADHLDSMRTGRSEPRRKRASGVPGPLSPRFDERGYASSQDTDQKSVERPPHVAYVRPLSADSIDDAVESYLSSPRLSQKIKHPQTGRVISFSEVGDSEGSAVFCCVGMGLTRYITAFYDELALTLKLRLITPDRPGVGDSEPYSDGTATPLSWPDDVYAICQALKITKFSILAHSAGAIYALATALRMPQHIRGRIHLLAPWIPPSQLSVYGASALTPPPPTNSIPTSQRILRALPTPILRVANSSFMAATSSSLTSSLPKTPKRNRRVNNATTGTTNKDIPTLSTSPGIENKENLLSSNASQSPAPVKLLKDMGALADMDRIMPDGPNTPDWTANGNTNGHRKAGSNGSTALQPPTNDAMADKERQGLYDMRLTQAIWELATTGANPAVDLLVCLERHHTIGFRYVDITRPIVMHHGSRDTRVPVENVKWLGKTMRRCEVRVLEGEGHGLMASASVMGSVLMEIAKEWEDWIRATGADGRAPRGRVGERRISAR